MITRNKINTKIIITCFFIILILLLYPVRHLEASLYNTNTILERWIIGDAEGFTIRFIHSVMLTPVYETYTFNVENEIILTETIFSSYGAGNPENTPYNFEITEKGFRIYNINKSFNDLVYRTGATIANHTIIFNDNEVPFLAFSSPASAVQFKVRTKTSIQFISEEVLLWLQKTLIKI